ncbi:unnamed protein product, partial [Mesorhabditis belari]|uniref:Protein kinase domain-containing protein n=1 Tax=Mesorhabditis belari TaxID=2138241 RepID=A0AAF3FQ60_9BILA
MNVARFLPESYVQSLAHFLPEDRVETVHFRHLKGYTPDISDKASRNPATPDDHFHILAKGEFGSIVAALLYYPSVDGVANPNELPKFEAKDEKWKRVVCKRYNVERLEKLNDGYTRLIREIEFGRFHYHESIVKYYEAFPEFDGTTKITHYWLVSERMDYNMEQYFRMQDYKKLDRKTFLYLIGSFLAQLLRGLDYLHQNGTMHRNIEPQHIGYNQHRSQLKILNFGLSR